MQMPFPKQQNKNLYPSYQVLGLMSGTSLDGLDLCLAQFWQTDSGSWKFTILAAETEAYPQIWEQRLRDAPKSTAFELSVLNLEYGNYIAEKCKSFLEKNILADENCIISSHGHTVFHQPQIGLSLQIGSGKRIAESTGKVCVCNFREQDVLFEGQGAPLVPFGDQELFGNHTACLNLGGFANISYESQGKRIGFDICPVNILLNFYAQKLGLEYDQDGKIAESYPSSLPIIQALNSIPFYTQEPPKSLGKEWVEEYCQPILRHITPELAISAITEHGAVQIARTLLKSGKKEVICTGGGALNCYLMKRIQDLAPQISFHTCSHELIQYKEALIFGFLGLTKVLGIDNVLCSVTGAKHDHCSGDVYLSVAKDFPI